MKISKNADIETTEINLLQQYGFRFLPYWPVFLVLLIFSLIIASFYLKFKAPVYEVTSSILIKDEKRGQDDSKVLDALNLFGAKKIVENEVIVAFDKQSCGCNIDNQHRKNSENSSNVESNRFEGKFSFFRPEERLR